jgi:hypothetical protein
MLTAKRDVSSFLICWEKAIRTRIELKIFPQMLSNKPRFLGFLRRPHDKRDGYMAQQVHQNRNPDQRVPIRHIDVDTSDPDGARDSDEAARRPHRASDHGNEVGDP